MAKLETTRISSNLLTKSNNYDIRYRVITNLTNMTWLEIRRPYNQVDLINC